MFTALKAPPRYFLAAKLVVRSKTLNAPGYRYGKYRVWGDLARSCYFRVSPDVPQDEAFELLGELKGAPLLDGVRGAAPADRAALAELMAALSRFAADHADAIEEIDLNPVIVHPQGQGLTIVDALIVKRSPDATP